MRFPSNSTQYLRAIGFDTRDSLQYPITSYKNVESVYLKEIDTLNIFEIIRIKETTTYNLYAYQNSGTVITAEYNLINAIRVSI